MAFVTLGCRPARAYSGVWGISGSGVPCPTKSLDKKTHFEVYSGRKPGIKHFKVFGSICYAYIPSHLRQKLDETSVKCIFMGYGTCEGYTLYNLDSKKMIVSRDVIFDENAC
ncbi:hypothetical protein ACFX15_008418 [Malus domestica]